MRVREIFKPIQNGDLSRFQTALATVPYSGTSSRYSFIPTSKPLAVLQDLGWKPVAYAEQRVRDTNKAGFQRHALKLRHELMSKDALQVGQTLPELVLVNSHCGNASFQLLLALFELVCSNGLMVEREGIANRSVRHVGYTNKQVELAVTSLVPHVQTILSDVDKFRKIKLLESEVKAFGQAAIELRWDGEKYSVKPESVTAVHRNSQQDNNLWNVYNRAQETILRGGVYVQNAETKQYQRARAVSGLTENIRLNKALWRLAEEMGKLKN